uniref:Uncharacterized protein n=1 Tax=Anguilla anguilla TaxID=7936 RepID=A0A0E9VL30_ANGAN
MNLHLMLKRLTFIVHFLVLIWYYFSLAVCFRPFVCAMRGILGISQRLLTA